MNPFLSLAGMAVDIIGNERFQIDRKRPITYIDGYAVEEAFTDVDNLGDPIIDPLTGLQVTEFIEATGSIHIISKNEMEKQVDSDEEYGAKHSSFIRIHTRVEILEATDQRNADIIKWQGKNWELINVKHRQEVGIYKALGGELVTKQNSI